MRKVLESMINTMIGGSNYEGFQGNPLDFKNVSGKNAMSMLIALVLVQILVLFFGKFLWNRAVVPLVSFANESTSIWQILGLSILIKLLM
jgi:hypothetical protein